MLNIFLRQCFNEMHMKKKKLNVGDSVRINQTSNIFEKKNCLLLTDLLKLSKVLDTQP